MKEGPLSVTIILGRPNVANVCLSLSTVISDVLVWVTKCCKRLSQLVYSDFRCTSMGYVNIHPLAMSIYYQVNFNLFSVNVASISPGTGTEEGSPVMEAGLGHQHCCYLFHDGKQPSIDKSSE